MRRIKQFAIGAGSGLAGAVLMGSAYAAVAKLLPQSYSQEEDPTETVAKAITRTLTGQQLEPSKAKSRGRAVHFAFGMSMGALYGMLADTSPALTAGNGALFGVAIYLGAHSLVVPALGLAASPVQNGPAREAPEFVAHIVYGVITETVRDLLSG